MGVHYAQKGITEGREPKNISVTLLCTCTKSARAFVSQHKKQCADTHKETPGKHTQQT